MPNEIVVYRKLLLNLPENWIDWTGENETGLPTFINRNNPNSGALQISIAEYKGGKIPNPSKKLLETMALTVCLRNNPKGKSIEQKSGSCEFGIYGTAAYSSEENPVFKIWYLSDSKDFVMVSYINTVEFDRRELDEAGKIVHGMSKQIATADRQSEK